MKKLTSIFLALILALSLFTPALAADGFDRISELSELVRDYSLEYKDKDTDPLLDALESLMEKDPELFNKLADEMIGSLDKYSHYMTADEYDTAFPKGSAYVGIGISVDPNYAYGVVVAALVEGGAAKEAGILPGDVIVYVDGKDVQFVPYTDVVDMLRGEANTEVNVSVRRQGNASLLQFKLTRRGLSTGERNVTYENLGDGVGYIKISRFSSLQDFFDFADIYNTIPYDDEIKSVIIDLRGNPGGDVAVTYNIINYIIREKDVPLFELINSDEDEVYTSTGMGVWTPNKLLVLVNENSASASEIFSGSLQALGVAEVIGQTTYGKGRSQYHFEMSDESVAIITAYEILLPGGKPYDGVGIVPDYLVEQEQTAYSMPKLSALRTDRGVYPDKAYSAQALALQQRLKALGVFPGEPDGIFDSLTLWAVKSFQKSMGLTVRAYADRETLAVINAEIEKLRKTTVELDTQLETAIELAVEAAAQPWISPPDPDTREEWEELE